MFINNNDLDDIEEKKHTSSSKKNKVEVVEETGDFYENNLNNEVIEEKKGFFKRLFTNKKKEVTNTYEEAFYDNNKEEINIEEEYAPTNDDLKINNRFMGKFTIIGLIIIVISLFLIFGLDYLKEDNFAVSLTSLGLIEKDDYQINILTNSKSISYKVDNSDIVNLNEMTGYIKALKEGVAKIRVLSNKKEMAIINVFVTKERVPITNFEIDSITVKVKNTKLLSMKLTPNNATDLSFTFTSQDESIVTVDNNGIVTGIKKGETSINVSNNNINKQVKIIVK